MKNGGIPMIPGVEPILLDLEHPFLPSRDLKNRRKIQKLEIQNFQKLFFDVLSLPQPFPGLPSCLYIELAMENPNLPSRDLKNRRKTQKLEI